MIDPAPFLAFSWLLFNSAGLRVLQGDGTLFHAPPRTTTPTSEVYYSSLRKTGWYCCPLGYAVGVFEWIEEGHRLVLPGLKVKGVCKLRGKSEDIAIWALPDFFEQHVAAVRDVLKEEDRSAAHPLEETMHDLRKMNANIYNVALQLDREMEARNYADDMIGLCGNIIALSEILSSRLDFIDLSLADVDLVSEVAQIPVYKKVDKSVRTFRVSARDRGIYLNLFGMSYGSLVGPRLFDTLIYIILDNMVKYSPAQGTVTVEVNETETTFEIRFEGHGPPLDGDEKLRLFDRGFRGKSAVRANASGSGIGLFLARRIAEEVFAGSISVQQSAISFEQNKRPFALTTFSIVLPKQNIYH